MCQLMSRVHGCRERREQKRQTRYTYSSLIRSPVYSRRLFNFCLYRCVFFLLTFVRDCSSCLLRPAAPIPAVPPPFPAFRSLARCHCHYHFEIVSFYHGRNRRRFFASANLFSSECFSSSTSDTLALPLYNCVWRTDSAEITTIS